MKIVIKLVGDQEIYESLKEIRNGISYRKPVFGAIGLLAASTAIGYYFINQWKLGQGTPGYFIFLFISFLILILSFFSFLAIFPQRYDERKNLQLIIENLDKITTNPSLSHLVQLMFTTHPKMADLFFLDDDDADKTQKIKNEKSILSLSAFIKKSTSQELIKLANERKMEIFLDLANSNTANKLSITEAYEYQNSSERILLVNAITVIEALSTLLEFETDSQIQSAISERITRIQRENHVREAKEKEVTECNSLISRLRSMSDKANIWSKSGQYVGDYPLYNEIRAIGTSLHRIGGMKMMESAYHQSGLYSERWWNGIGTWEA